MTIPDKAALRQLLLKKRKELSTESIQQKSQQIFQRFIQSEQNEKLLSTPNKRIGLYSPIKAEVDTTQFFQYFLANGFKVFFPKIEAEHIRFYEVQGAHQLFKGSFQVLEPLSQSAAPLLPETLFIPGLAFSQNTGARLGFGKGYYDKFFAAHPNLTIRKIGLSYDFQVVPNFQTNPTDICMDFVLTESRLIKFKL